MDNNVDDPDRYNSPRLNHGDFVRLIKNWSERLILFESYSYNKIAADFHGYFAVYGREIFRRLVIVHKVGKHRSVRPEKIDFSAIAAQARGTARGRSRRLGSAKGNV